MQIVILFILVFWSTIKFFFLVILDHFLIILSISEEIMLARDRSRRGELAANVDPELDGVTTIYVVGLYIC